MKTLESLKKEKERKTRQRAIKRIDKAKEQQVDSKLIQEYLGYKLKKEIKIDGSVEMKYIVSNDGSPQIFYEFKDIDKNDDLLWLLAYSIISERATIQLNNDATEKDKKKKIQKSSRAVISSAKHYCKLFISSLAEKVMKGYIKSQKEDKVNMKKSD